MEQSKIDRINYLAKKARGEGLSEAEKAEQKCLREEYIEGFKNSLTKQLSNIYIIDEQGEKRKLDKKK